jgi:hypothetical protein
MHWRRSLFKLLSTNGTGTDIVIVLSRTGDSGKTKISDVSTGCNLMSTVTIMAEVAARAAVESWEATVELDDTEELTKQRNAVAQQTRATVGPKLFEAFTTGTAIVPALCGTNVIVGSDEGATTTKIWGDDLSRSQIKKAFSHTPTQHASAGGGERTITNTLVASVNMTPEDALRVVFVPEYSTLNGAVVAARGGKTKPREKDALMSRFLAAILPPKTPHRPLAAAPVSSRPQPRKLTLGSKPSARPAAGSSPSAAAAHAPTAPPTAETPCTPAHITPGAIYVTMFWLQDKVRSSVLKYGHVENCLPLGNAAGRLEEIYEAKQPLIQHVKTLHQDDLKTIFERHYSFNGVIAKIIPGTLLLLESMDALIAEPVVFRLACTLNFKVFGEGNIPLDVAVINAGMLLAQLDKNYGEGVTSVAPFTSECDDELVSVYTVTHVEVGKLVVDLSTEVHAIFATQLSSDELLNAQSAEEILEIVRLAATTGEPVHLEAIRTSKSRALATYRLPTAELNALRILGSLSPDAVRKI